MARAKNEKELQADLEKLKEKEKTLKARIRAAQARESAAERKLRNHALMTMGAWVENACGGDWRAVDWEALHGMLMRYSGNYRKVASHGGRAADEANAELRGYERELRERAAEAKRETKRAQRKALDAIPAAEPGRKHGINIEAFMSSRED